MMMKFGNREALVYLSGHRGVVILFHGFLESVYGFKNRAGLESLLDLGYNVVYPIGLFRSWYTIFGHREADLRFFDNIYNFFGYSQVIVGGFSDGAYFANYVGNSRSECVSKLISCAGGFIEEQFTTENKYPVLILQGDNDMLNHQSKSLETKYISAGHIVKYMTSSLGHRWPKFQSNEIVEWIDVS